MATISFDDVQKLARLSALTITEEQAEVISHELTKIFEYIEQLSDVETTDVEPTYQGNGLENVTRADEIIDYHVSQAELLKNAPQQHDGSIKVPRVLE